MKKYLLCASALLALCSCEEKEDIMPEDKISVAPDTKTFEKEGGRLQVLVTSSSDWELASAEDYSAWCTPSVTSGKDGDIVTFTVEPEDVYQNYNATYTFTCGKASDELAISFVGKALLPIEVVSEKSVSCDYNGGELKILLSTEVEPEFLEIGVTEGTETWLEHVVTKESSEAGVTAEVIYNIKEYDDLDAREAVIAISAPGAVPAEVEVHQTPRLRLETTELFYKLELSGGNLEIPVSANVTYEFKVSDGADWLEYRGKDGNNEVFAVGELSAGKRSAEIVFIQTGVASGVEPMTFTVTVTQAETIIKWAADMTGSRLYPRWDGTKPSLNMANFTLETLFYVDELKGAGEVSAIMGNDSFLVSVRYDEEHKVNYLSVKLADIYRYEIKSIVNYSGEYVPEGKIEAKRWYHVAVTFAGAGGAKMYVYLDGKEVSYGSSNYPRNINFGSPAFGSGDKYGFYVGYNELPSNDLKGMVSEVRIWTKTLTASDLAEENHFYQVDPSSDGLVAYWPFKAGSGTEIFDVTAGGNRLYGETDVIMNGTENTGIPGINWVSVALPDK